MLTEESQSDRMRGSAVRTVDRTMMWTGAETRLKPETSHFTVSSIDSCIVSVAWRGVCCEAQRVKRIGKFKKTADKLGTSAVYRNPYGHMDLRWTARSGANPLRTKESIEQYLLYSFCFSLPMLACWLIS